MSEEKKKPALVESKAPSLCATPFTPLDPLPADSKQDTKQTDGRGGGGGGGGESAESANESADSANGRQCPICYEAPAVWLVNPCSHSVACDACFAHLQKSKCMHK